MTKASHSPKKAAKIRSKVSPVNTPENQPIKTADVVSVVTPDISPEVAPQIVVPKPEIAAPVIAMKIPWRDSEDDLEIVEPTGPPSIFGPGAKRLA